MPDDPTADASSATEPGRESGTDAELDAVADPTAGVRRSPAQRRLRAGFLLVVLVFAVLAVAGQWEEVSDRLGDLSAFPVVLSAVFAVGALASSFLAWRETLAGLGHRLALPVAARIFFLGQLAKYVPGSIWAIVGQVELARAVGVRRERTATAGIVVLVISLAVGLTLGLLAVPALLDAEADVYLWLLGLLVPLAVVLQPAVLTRLVNAGLRLVRRPPLDEPLTAATVLRVAGFSVASNGLLGLQIWQLADDLGGDGLGLVALSIGGYGIAAAASLVVIPLPAGAGLREAILVLVLAPEIGAASATLVALIARLTLTLADLGVAGGVAAGTRTLQPVAHAGDVVEGGVEGTAGG